MKKCFLFMAILAFSLQTLMGQVYKTVHVATPGTLSELLTEEEKNTITDLTITGTIDSLDFSVFSPMISLENLDLGGCSVSGNRIPSQAFLFAANLHHAILPPEVTVIGWRAFNNCIRLEEVVLPQNLKTIEREAFEYCPSLTTIVFSNQLESIGREAFVMCWHLKEIELPSSLKSIGENCFWGTRIKELHIPENVEEIGVWALVTDSLTHITVDALNKTFSSEEGVLFNKEMTELLMYPPCKQDSFYSIPSSVTVVYTDTYPIYLESVYIPASVTKITGLLESRILAELKVNETSMSFKSVNNVLFNKEQTELIRFAPKQNTTRYVIPESVEKIGRGAFEYANALERVVFPNSLDSIGGSGFAHCHLLDSIVLPQSLRTLGGTAFYECRNLSSAKIPPSIDSLAAFVFGNCVSLDSLTIPSSIKFFSFTNLKINPSSLDKIKINTSVPPAVGSIDFYNIDTIITTIYVPLGSLQAYTSDPFWGAFDIEEFEFYLNTASEYADINNEGGSGGASIISNTEWNISSDCNWLHVNSAVGMDNGEVTFSVDANPDADRQGVITINGHQVDPVYITVNQEGNPATNIETDETTEIKVFVSNRKLVIENAANHYLTVYSIQGNQVLSGKILSEYEELNIQHLPAGVYLVKAGNHSEKISLTNMGN